MYTHIYWCLCSIWPTDQRGGWVVGGFGRQFPHRGGVHTPGTVFVAALPSVGSLAVSIHFLAFLCLCSGLGLFVPTDDKAGEIAEVAVDFETEKGDHITKHKQSGKSSNVDINFLEPTNSPAKCDKDIHQRPLSPRLWWHSASGVCFLSSQGCLGRVALARSKGFSRESPFLAVLLSESLVPLTNKSVTSDQSSNPCGVKRLLMRTARNSPCSTSPFWASQISPSDHFSSKQPAKVPQAAAL
eukprot:g69816.t1